MSSSKLTRPTLDCGDNSCRFKEATGGMRTNGGCRCLGDGRMTAEERLKIVKYIKDLQLYCNWLEEQCEETKSHPAATT